MLRFNFQYNRLSHFSKMPNISTMCRSRQFCVQPSQRIPISEMMRTMNEAQRISGNRVEPIILAMQGNQSAAKSSTIEAITNLPLLPKGSNMVTKRPLKLNLVNIPIGQPMSAQFGEREKRLHDINLIRDRIYNENRGNVTNSPIDLTIYSPDVYDMVITDLPGYIQLSNADQDEDLPEKIIEMNGPYIDNPNCINVLVRAAPNDPLISSGLKFIKKANQLDNTICVLTKCDLVKDKKMLEESLQNTEFNFGYGVMGLVLRSAEEIKAGMTIEDKVEDEARLIKKWDLKGCDMGVPLLRRRLSEIYIKRSLRNIPTMLTSIEKEINRKKKEIEGITSFSNTGNTREVAKGIKAIIDELHDLAPERPVF